MKDYESCTDCGVQLRKVKNLRVKPTKCHDCRNHSANYELAKLHLQCAKDSRPDLDEHGEEVMFQDVAYDVEESIMHRSSPSNTIGVKSSLGTL
jgi:hypothetical protein